jgi:WD40 repeat protein/hemolysin type calcium-binding protein
VRRIALLVVVAAALSLFHAGHGRALNCHANDAWQDRFPSWSPNGDMIAFMRQQPECDPPAESLGFVTPGSPEQIFGTDGNKGSWAPPSWAPSGLVAAYGRDRESVGVTAPSGPVGDDGPGLFPSWAGNSIAVTVGASLEVIELISGVRRVLVPAYVKPTQSTGLAAWSPDRQWLAFGWKSTTVEGGAIAVVRADGSSFRLLALGPNQAVNPTWSPDGQTIAFETNRDRDFEIYSVRLDGSDVRNLTHAPQGDDRMPAWHGNTIAFISNRDRSPRDLYGFSLFTISPDGSNLRWHARDLHPYSPLAWSPDGSRIAFSSGRECLRWGIYVFDLRTDAVRRVTNQCIFDGTLRDDILEGTPFLDFIDAGPGRDIVYGLGGADTIRGDLGADSLWGGIGRDTLIGGPGDDVIFGGDAGDRILSADRGHDRVFGGRGDDLIESGSGSRDVIVCGPGRDTVRADRLDRVARDCERASR